uniref:Uncharacterized protein n=1 Tax=Opuntia streptacantha TaxID=393608 RepID=A0A7C8ZSG4_OPUST
MECLCNLSIGVYLCYSKSFTIRVIEVTIFFGQLKDSLRPSPQGLRLPHPLCFCFPLGCGGRKGKSSFLMDGFRSYNITILLWIMPRIWCIFILHGYVFVVWFIYWFIFPLPKRDLFWLIYLLPLFCVCLRVSD